MGPLNYMCAVIQNVIYWKSGPALTVAFASVHLCHYVSSGYVSAPVSPKINYCTFMFTCRIKWFCCDLDCFALCVFQMLYFHCSPFSQVHKWPFHRGPRKPRRRRRVKQKEETRETRKQGEDVVVTFHLSSRDPFCARRSGMVRPVTSLPCGEKKLLFSKPNSRSVSQTDAQTRQSTSPSLRPPACYRPATYYLMPWLLCLTCF